MNYVYIPQNMYLCLEELQMKKFALVALSILIATATLGQTNAITPILQQLDQSDDSLQKVYLYNQLANRLKTTDVDRAIYYTKNALTLANQISSPEACGITNELMGELFEKKNNLQPSINYYFHRKYQIFPLYYSFY